MVERLIPRARLGFPAHAHMVGHACAFKLANDGVDTRTIQAFLGTLPRIKIGSVLNEATGSYVILGLH